MENLYTFFFGITLLLVVFVILIVWIYYRHVRYTRERFAFFAVASFTGFILSGIGLLMVDYPFFNWLINLLNKQYSLQLPPYQREEIWLNAGILVFSTFMLFFLIRTLFFNWRGEKSVRQVTKEDTKSKISIWQDAEYYWREVVLAKRKIEIAKQKAQNKREVFSEFESDARPWHLKAIELLKLYNQQQYNIHTDKDWHRDYNAYFGYYGSEGKRLGVLCLHEHPTSNEFDHYLKMAESLEGEFKAHIVLVKGEGKRPKQKYLQELFEYRYEDELLESLINFTDYRHFIQKEFEEKRLENSDLSLADMYVPLGGQIKTVVKGKMQKVENGDIESVEQYILDWVKDESKNDKEHLAILGDYGQGKTVLTQKIVHEMLQNSNDYSRIPILIELRGSSPRNETAFDILAKWTTRYRTGNANALWELHCAGKLLIILDGFDEMDLVGDTEMLFQHFSSLWTLASVPQSKIIITGRPNLFADDSERREALGIVPPRLNLPYSKAIYLNLLTKPQIKHALRHVQTATQKGILNTLDKIGTESSFGELIARPSTLYQLSTVWDKELVKHRDRLNSATVISSFLDKAYQRQEVKQSTFLTTQERNYFLMGIAVGMMLQNEYTNQIKKTELKTLVERLWSNFPEKLPPYKDALQGGVNKVFLKKRLEKNPQPLDVILRDVHTGGVLVTDPSVTDSFKFAHKSYMEYLVSAFYTGFVLKNEQDKTQLMVVNSIAETFRFKQTQLVASADVERFVAENIVAQIELTDKNGKVMPILQHREAYAKAIFNKVIPSWYGRCFPNLTGWCSLHPAQKYLLYISFTSYFVLFLDLFIKQYSPFDFFSEENSIFNILYLLLLLGLIIILSIFNLWLPSINKPMVNFISKYELFMRLYSSCWSLIIKEPFLIKSKYQKLIKCKTNNRDYQSIILTIMSIFVFMASMIPASSCLYLLILHIYTIDYSFILILTLFSICPYFLFFAGFKVISGFIAGIGTGVGVILVLVILVNKSEVNEFMYMVLSMSTFGTVWFLYFFYIELKESISTYFSKSRY